MTSRYRVSYKINPFCTLHSRQIHVINGWRGWLWWEFGHLFKLSGGHRWQKAKEQKPWRFPLNRKQRSLLFYVIFVQYTKFWLEFGLHKYLDKLWIHLVKESVHLTVSLGISKIVSTTSCMSRIEKLITFNMTCNSYM